MSPATPSQAGSGRVLSALHVNFSEIAMGQSLDRGAFGEVFHGRWRGNDIAVKVGGCVGVVLYVTHSSTDVFSTSG